VVASLEGTSKETRTFPQQLRANRPQEASLRILQESDAALPSSQGGAHPTSSTTLLSFSPPAKANAAAEPHMTDMIDMINMITIHVWVRFPAIASGHPSTKAREMR
jgi:hypothetical protein